MKGENVLINNENELKESWKKREKIFWDVNDGVGDRRCIYSEELTYEQFKEKINWYLNKVVNGQKDAYIKEQNY